MKSLCERCDSIKSASFFNLIKISAYLAAIYFGVKYILPILLPFIFGLSIAAMVQKPADLLASRIPHISRRACRRILTAAVIIISLLLIAAAICSIFSGAMKFCPCIPDYLVQAENFINNAADSGSQSAWGKFVNFVAKALEWGIDFVSENYKQYLPSVLSKSTKLIGRLPSFITAAVFAIISAMFACGDFDRILSSVKSYIPKKAMNFISLITKTAVRTITSLLKTYGTLMMITFGELTLGFFIMRLFGYNIGNIVTTAFIIALIDILPILGTGTVLIPWALFEIITDNTVQGIMLLVMFGIIGIIRNFLEPKFMGSSLELHPFFTLSSVYIGGKIFGASGIIILPLALIVLRETYSNQKTTQ
ncbi:MAG: AI-2E family transporter [Firmicutes bacterium]|nr:AI-2E family transporter [Bacillota bacterium]